MDELLWLLFATATDETHSVKESSEVQELWVATGSFKLGCEGECSGKAEKKQRPQDSTPKNFLRRQHGSDDGDDDDTGAVVDLSITMKRGGHLKPRTTALGRV
ncbi:hypothetical protein AK812_SmicGene34975 [Symbiodinium microadriaticum]|uniref:Uncharacterized protein n=1 Tax=Symbiodinium microadriaticum TaxID=2951 RepID=A0A1Q9CMN3_SYMMI|nr:hypothetical protein AK812_SmicGene34975 [Symbiodinium microadriaticum]